VNVELSRRGLLQAGAAVGGGLLLRLWIPEARGAEAPASFAPNAFLSITRDKASFFVTSTEMGQGVSTSLPLILCEELELDPQKLDIQLAGAARKYDNPEMRSQITGGSASVRTLWDPLREAGAIAREMLKVAAASSWGIAAGQLEARDGRIVHPDGRSASYGELAELAANVSVPTPALKRPEEYRWVGKYAGPRLDVAKKVDGSAEFGMDVKLPGLRVAVVVRSPTFGGKVKSFDESAARAMPGVEDVLQIETGVAVVATTYWHARQAANVLRVEWDPGPNGSLSTQGIRERYQKAVAAGGGKTAKNEGDAVAALAKGTRVHRAVYEAPFLAHAAMEPMNATARVTAEKAEIWCGTQTQTAVKGLAAKLTGLALDQVEVHTTFAGGGFGRRSVLDFPAEAVVLSQKTQKPIKVVWSREDDMRGWQYRPYSYHEISAALNESGKPVALVHKLAVQSLLKTFGVFVPYILPDGMPGFMKSGLGGVANSIVSSIADPTATEGSANSPYEIPNHRVELFPVDLPIPIASWRSVGNSFNGFVVESFIDELAHAAGQDPFEYRRALLKYHHRYRWVLELAAEKAGWRTPPPPGVFRGIAQHACFESYAAAVAEVSIDDGQIHVRRLVTTIDCGQVIHPDNVHAQLESAAAYGLSAALKQELTLVNGAVTQSNFHDYEVIRMFEMPKIETHLVVNQAHPTGVGELGVPPIAPAVANAVFAATGKRLRRLPLSLSG
jgi:isoquinoline 1-oxidoreductase beta subunit